MTNIYALLNQITSAETELDSAQFLAPCVRGGRVRTRLNGLVYTFTPKPRKFEGWGIFQPLDRQTAKLIEVADLVQITEYLRHFQAVRLRLAAVLEGQTWLAYPTNEADVRQRFGVVKFGAVKPVPVHLVTDGVAFEQIVARRNGQSCWFEQIDRQSDPIVPEMLQAALKQLIPVADLRLKGLTPEMRSTYELATQRLVGFDQPQQDERRLRRALQAGGGQLNQFHDRGDYWTVDWATADGECHTSAIGKDDLTVVSSGICLSGRDRDFDLHSLVGVIEQQEHW